jgi:Zn-finger nucleic acid-binding protein
MYEITYKGVTIDRCADCRGIWFDEGEAERLKNEWMSEFLDDGDPKEGQEFDSLKKTVYCPRCDEPTPMDKLYDPKQTHIWYEACPKGHGKFFDAGEFTDWIYNTVLDRVREIKKGKRPDGKPGPT